MNEQDELLSIEIFKYIRAYWKERLFAPTMREIGEACFMSHSNTASHLARLEGWGWIRRAYKVPRSIGILETAPNDAALEKLIQALHERETKKKLFKQRE